MAVDAISASQGSLVNGGKIVSSSKQGQLSMQDYFKIMAAELQNQDPESATDTSQYLNQMAEFGVLEQLTSLSTSMNYAIASGMVGKQASYSHFDETSGMTVEGDGTVDAVDLTTSTTPYCLISDKWYPLSEITAIGNPNASGTGQTTATSNTASVSQPLTQQAALLEQSMASSAMSALNDDSSQQLAL